MTGKNFLQVPDGLATTRRSGCPATRLPGDPAAARRPGDAATAQRPRDLGRPLPGDPATRLPTGSDPAQCAATRRPGDSAATGLPGDPVPGAGNDATRLRGARARDPASLNWWRLSGQSSPLCPEFDNPTARTDRSGARRGPGAPVTAPSQHPAPAVCPVSLWH
jgi:hypothetical protein